MLAAVTVEHDGLLAEWLRARELCRLARTCRALRDALARAPAVWARLAARTARAQGGAPLAEPCRRVLEWDEGAAVGSALASRCGSRTLLVLGAQPASLRACAAHSAAAFTRAAAEARRAAGAPGASAVAEWTVRVHALRAPPHVVLWLGACFPRVDPPGGSSLGTSGARALLRPFAREGGSVCGSGARVGLAERWAASEWSVLALGSTGWVWGCALSGRHWCPPLPAPEVAAADAPALGGAAAAAQSAARAHGAAPGRAPSARERAPLDVRVRVDFTRGELSFGVGSAPMRLAARRLFSRGQPPPARVWALAHLTDVTARTPHARAHAGAEAAGALLRAATQDRLAREAAGGAGTSACGRLPPLLGGGGGASAAAGATAAAAAAGAAAAGAAGAGAAYADIELLPLPLPPGTAAEA